MKVVTMEKNSVGWMAGPKAAVRAATWVYLMAESWVASKVALRVERSVVLMAGQTAGLLVG